MLEEIIELVHKTKDIITEEQKNFDVSLKGKKDYVTNIDLAVSRFLSEKLNEMYPEYTFMDEEFNSKVTDFSKPTWILDPIDGTTNLIHDYNLSAISLGLVKNEEPILAVVYNPFMEEMFAAEKGRGAYLNGKQIKVSDVSDVSQALVAIGTNPYIRSDREKTSHMFKIFENLFMNTLEIRRLGSAALDLCYVACGRSDVFFEYNLKPWDVAAGILILSEAGGITTDLENRGVHPIANSDIVATNGKIHERILEIINKT